MKQFLLIIISIIIIGCISGGCKKEGCFTDALIINAGLPEADGCGWLIKIDSTHYKAINLPEQYEVHNLQVKITYESVETKYACGFAQTQIDQIKINQIKKR